MLIAEVGLGTQGSVRVFLERYKAPAAFGPPQGIRPAQQATARSSLPGLRVGSSAGGAGLAGARQPPGENPVDGAAPSTKVAMTQPPGPSSAVSLGPAKRVTHVGGPLTGKLLLPFLASPMLCIPHG
jgi:hypothetical protein